MVKKKRQKNKKRVKIKKKVIFLYLKDLLIACGIVLFLLMMVSSFYFKGIKVEGYGMMPTLRDKDIVLAKKTKEINRFDLVVLKIGNKQQVRRVIGLADELVQYKDDVLLIDGAPVDEKFIMDEINESQHSGRSFTEDFSSGGVSGLSRIPKGYYLVLGDNRPYATDSRHYGLVAERNIIGILTMRLLPANDIKAF
ncbi:signal peptidase I [Enterococcus crotali]|uniref:signal peptidase I n=1 Tax=Enterococcus crotali TaxID=1453587 RepID=UPI00046F59BD|nr:signal peptidase I [Enterococcus crotali]OTP53949.1 signal peptidase I [Enterococcus termitis]